MNIDELQAKKAELARKHGLLLVQYSDIVQRHGYNGVLQNDMKKDIIELQDQMKDIDRQIGEIEGKDNA